MKENIKEIALVLQKFKENNYEISALSLEEQEIVKFFDFQSTTGIGDDSIRVEDLGMLQTEIETIRKEVESNPYINSLSDLFPRLDSSRVDINTGSPDFESSFLD